MNGPRAYLLRCAVHAQSGIYLLDEGELVGIFGFKDMMTRAIAKEMPLELTAVSSVMLYRGPSGRGSRQEPRAGMCLGAASATWFIITIVFGGQAREIGGTVTYEYYGLRVPQNQGRY